MAQSQTYEVHDENQIRELVFKTSLVTIARLYVFTQPLRHGQDVTLGQFSSGFIAILNSEFSFLLTICLTKAK